MEKLSLISRNTLSSASELANFIMGRRHMGRSLQYMFTGINTKNTFADVENKLNKMAKEYQCSDVRKHIEKIQGLLPENKNITISQYYRLANI